jgi:3-deoxy-manno-octulosonate cytidylyltransferase (CMP-KDO synthetase)
MSTRIIIPARYASTRLPGKLLLPISGKPLIQHVYEQAARTQLEVIVAADDSRVAEAVKRFGGRVCMTSPQHQSGTERIAEVVTQLKYSDDDIVINLQGDEPLMPPAVILQLVDNLARQKQVSMATSCVAITSKEELFNPNVSKVVLDHAGFALYFSRAPIPWYRDGFNLAEKKMPAEFTYYRHLGIYAYRVAFLKRYVTWPASPLEEIESLEQLRVLWQGEKIYVGVTTESVGYGVDIKEDYLKVKAALENL